MALRWHDASAEPAMSGAGLTLAEIGSLASRPFVGMEEEPSELERLCLEVRAQLEALSDEDTDRESSTTDTDEECIMQADHYFGDASHVIGDGARAVSHVAQEGHECASSSRMSSGTLYNASGSYELSLHGSARLSGNVMSDTSRCSLLSGHPL